MQMKQLSTFIKLDTKMLKDNFDSISNIPNPSIAKGSITKKLIEFLESTLLIFQSEFRNELNAAEEVLNEYLGKTLNYHSKTLPFIFQQETIQKQNKGQNRKVDIGVFYHYADSNPFYTIEAKRLPTLPRKREKEYVFGDDQLKLSGGIERYKHNVHGVNLSQSALVAYIQKENPRFWFNEINDWIDQLISGKIESELSWNSDDFLINTCGFKNACLAKFKSTSNKSNNTQIILNHYFVNLNHKNM